MNKIRWIDLGGVEPKFGVGINRYPLHYKINTPVIITYNRIRASIEFTDLTISYKEQLKNLPDDIDVIRYKYNDKLIYGPVVGSPGVTDFCIFTNSEWILEKIFLSVCKILRDKSMKSYVDNNNLMINYNSKNYKIGGHGGLTWDNGNTTQVIYISFRPRVDIIESTLTTIKHHITGLSDVNPSINENELIEDIIVEICKLLKCDYYKDNLSEDEFNKIDEISDRYYTDDWVFQ